MYRSIVMWRTLGWRAIGVGLAAWTAGLTFSHAASTDLRLAKVLGALKQVETGQKLISGARQKWALKDDFELLTRLRWAFVSKTDRTLIREWDPSTGLEIQRSLFSIWLKQAQVDGALVLDLAHELTHAIKGPAWDPYDPDLTPSKFVLASIDGAGGEVDALETECRVAFEFARSELVGRLNVDVARCERYGTGLTGTDREKIAQDFYRVGKWKRDLDSKLSEGVAEKLSDSPPQLYSSTGHAPYPVSLLEEYEAINESACQNAARRLSAESDASQDQTKVFLARRCSKSSLVE